jgi:hypothetical protein
MSMLIIPEKELTKKNLITPFKFLEKLEQLEKEEELHNQKIEELMESEQQLLVRISNIVILEIQRNEELKEQVEVLERNCGELTKFLESLLTCYREP